MDKNLSRKKLGIMVAMAMGFSLAFGGTPSEAMAAATTVASVGNYYDVNGTTMTYSQMMDAVKAAISEAGSTVTIGDSASATAIGYENLTLGAESTLLVKGSTNTATIIGGSTASNLKIDGTMVVGTDVHLTSLEVSVIGGKVAKSALNGSVGEFKVTGAGKLIFNSTSDSLKVDKLSVTDGTSLTVSDGAVVTAATTTIGSGATLASTTGTITTTSLVVESGAQIASGTTMKADNVIVDGTDSNISAQLANLKLSSATTGGTVNVEIQNATAAQMSAIISAAKTAAQAGGAAVKIDAAVAVTGNGDSYTVGATTGVTKADLATAVANAYAGGATKITLDKASAQALQGTDVTIPAGSTMVVADSTGSVSATAKNAATIKVDGLSVAGANDARFTDVTVDAGSSQTASSLTGVTADTVTIKSGTVKAGNVTATNLNLNGGTVNIDGAMNAATVIVDGGTVTAAAAGTTATITATTAAIKSGMIAAAIQATDSVTVSGGTVAAGSTISARTVAIDGGSLDGAVVKADNVTVSNASALKGSTLDTTAVTTTTALTAEEKAMIAAAVPAGKTVTVTDSTGAQTSVNGSQGAKIQVTADSNGTYKVGGTAGVTKDKLVETIAAAYQNGAATVELDKASTQALQGADVTIPAGKTMVVADSTGSVSVTAKKDAIVQLNGLSVSGTNDASFTDVMVNVGSNTVMNTLTGVTADQITVVSGKIKTSDVTAGTLTVSGGDIITDGTLTADTISISGGVIEAATAGSAPTLKAATVKIDGGTISGVVIQANTVEVSNVDSLAGSTIHADTIKATATLTAAEKAAIAAAVPSGVAFTLVDAAGSATLAGTKGASSTDVPSDATIKAITAYQEALKKDSPVQPSNPVSVCAAQAETNKKANPFTTKISTASDVAGVRTAVSTYNQALDDYTAAVNTYKEILTNASKGLSSITADEVARYNAAYGTAYKSVTEMQAALQAKEDAATSQSTAKITDAEAAAAASSLQSSIQEAGRTLAAPALAGSRTMLVVSNVMEGNVVNRTAELRDAGLASAVDDQQVKTQGMTWFQIKHGNMDVDDSSIYGKSRVKYTNYQLGYDTKLGRNNYIGGFMSTMSGDATFDGATASGTVTIENGFGVGLYGTHMLPGNQYIDALLQAGTMDNKYAGTTWNTRSLGAMVGYGVNIASSEKLTLNPYVRLSYNRITTDDATFSSGNTVSADKQGNLAMKLGLNLKAASGLYGGFAYSRGLSGDYQATVNGVAMPSSKNKANVVYLNLGYRGNVGPNTTLEFGAEKTFVDYVGWNVSGRVNFLFW